MKKVVLVTGASAGMGKETSRLFLEAGYVVYGAARRVEKMQELEKLGVRILAMDVTDENSMTQGVEAILRTEGRIDVLVNNAGFGSHGAVEEVPLESARYQMDVNLFGIAKLIQLVLPAMRLQRSGKIINISSIGGKLATPLGGWYHASKFALEALSDSLRMEVRQFGIDVVVIEPGGVKTEWGGIAGANLMKVSGDGVYKKMAVRFTATLAKTEPRGAESAVIAKLIVKAAGAKKPRTRYSGGFLAKPLLFMRKILSDRMMDAVLMSQLN